MDYRRSRRKGKQETSNDILPWVFSALVVAVLGAGLFIYQQRQTEGRWAAFTAYVGGLKSWVAERRQRIQTEVAEVKAIAEAKDEASPKVHFEFYTSLPNMQMVAASAAPAQPAAAPSTPRPVVVSRADDLEKDVLSVLQSQPNNKT